MKDRFRGMSYTELSREAMSILRKAAENGNWHAVLDDLIEIRAQMRVAAQSEVAA